LNRAGKYSSPCTREDRAVKDLLERPFSFSAGRKKGKKKEGGGEKETAFFEDSLQQPGRSRKRPIFYLGGGGKMLSGEVWPKKKLR